MFLQFLITIFLFSSTLAFEQVCNHQDQSSLIAFSANISISPSSTPLNWSFSIDCCQWEGVDCDSNGRVTHLQLPSRGLQGIITSSIGSLVKLTHLNLSNNHLHGTLPWEGIVGLTNLKVIDLSSNSLHGSIPREIGKLFYLEKLYLPDNKLHGPIPSSLMNCSKLEDIILRLNLLSGDISKLDFSRLIHLRKLDLVFNMLEGTIPESIYSCKSLVAFRVGENNITGQISPKIGRLKSLTFISLGFNSLTNISASLRALARCKNLTILLLSHNFYGEPLPIHKNFIGLSGFPKLQVLDLSYCNFGGPTPNWLSNLNRLRYLSLLGNKMRGKVPDWLGTLPNLSQLDLSDNSFSGEFPVQLCQLPSLTTQNKDANHTYFQFDLPTKILGLHHDPVICWTSAIHIRYEIDLSSNRFSGNIPLQIGNLKSLQYLNLSGNNFSGHIPVGISNLKNMEGLDLSRNILTGEIPTSLQSLNFMGNFNVSYNNLEGPIPIGGQFDTFDEFSFIGNPHLCGEQINHPCTNNASTDPKTNNVIDRYVRSGGHRMHDFVNGLMVGGAFGFSSVLAIVASYFLLQGKSTFFEKSIYAAQLSSDNLP